MKLLYPLVLALTFSTTTVAEDAKPEKHHEDPTKIITKFGIGYDGDMRFGGSIGLDETRKINGKISADGDEWSLGGSWLFEKGIVNVYVDGDDDRTSYNIGTYVPLSYFGVDTGKWMVFPMGGASLIEPKHYGDTSYGGYLGAFGIRPVNEQVSVVSYVGATVASNSYFGYWGGAGISYLVKPKHSLRSMVKFTDNDFDSDISVTVAYTIEF